ncbi:MAG: (d)CMP kinase [Chitinophagaceae bacterium]|nr:(d)CMP kinase [Chitinophagaceae bacterium]
MKKIIIAIDGHSSTGKSTLARQLAGRLHYTYIDSGAMYRAITYYFLQQQTDTSDHSAVTKSLEQIKLHFVDNKIHLNGVAVEHEIRTMQVSGQVSEVAALGEVRSFAVAQQQLMGLEKGIVMDGRDIGTTVFPQAELKIFLTASETIRAQRRFAEMSLKGQLVTIDEVSHNLQHRDHIDSTRAISPLRKADDAVVLDNSHLSMSEQLDIAYRWALQKAEDHLVAQEDAGKI